MRLQVDSHALDLTLEAAGEDWMACVGGATHRIVRLATGPRTAAAPGVTVTPVTFTIDGRVHAALVARQGDATFVALGGYTYRITTGAADARRSAGRLAGSGRVAAPMPGKITAVRVRAGDAVAAGDALVILEAMKMETTLAAEVPGVVAAVHVAAGAMVDEGTVLVEISPCAD